MIRSLHGDTPCKSLPCCPRCRYTLDSTRSRKCPECGADLVLVDARCLGWPSSRYAAAAIVLSIAFGSYIPGSFDAIVAFTAFPVKYIDWYVWWSLAAPAFGALMLVVWILSRSRPVMHTIPMCIAGMLIGTGQIVGHALLTYAYISGMLFD